MKIFAQTLIVLSSGAIAFSQPGPAAASSPGSTRSSTALTAESPITPGERFRWVVGTTLGPANLAAGVFVSGWRTQTNSPEEYGTHWDGFGKRYGLRLAGGGATRSIEAGLGSIWGEDPRYFRAAGQPLSKRMGHVFKMTFMATNRQGETMPAYARYIAIPSGTLLSNAWRPESQANVHSAVARIPFSFLDALIGRTFAEFFPDLRQRLFRQKTASGHETN